MGCASSKIFRRSGFFKKEVRHSLQRVNGLEELLASKNGGDQFLALLCTTNTVARKLKAGPATHEHEADTNASVEFIDSRTIIIDEPDHNTNPKAELTNVETVNTWELLAGLEEGNKEQQQSAEVSSTAGLPCTSFRMTEEYKFIVNNDSEPSKSFNSSKQKPEGSVVRTRSFRTVEEYDAMVARNHSLEEGNCASQGSESSIKECTADYQVEWDGMEEEGEHVKLEPENINTTPCAKEIVSLKSDLTREKGSRRKSMAKQLAALKVPAFEFSKNASLRDWLLQGGQVFSPGSYVTPKFGDFVRPVMAKDGNIGTVFDPEMVTHFEQSMKQLTIEEESILKQIVESLDRGNEEGISRISNTTQDMQM